MLQPRRAAGSLFAERGLCPLFVVAIVAAAPIPAWTAEESPTATSLRQRLDRPRPGQGVVALYERNRLVEVRVYGGAESSSPASAAHPAAPAARAQRPTDDDGDLSLEAAIEALRRPADDGRVERALDVFRDVEGAPLEPLLEFAAAGRDADLRNQALEVLVERGRGDPRVHELLRRVAARDRDEDARETARALLENLERGP